MQAFIREVIAAGLLHSAHDCADGGFAVALAESCLLGNVGAWVGLDEMEQLRSDPSGEAGILFGESQSRFVVSFPREALVQLHELSSRRGVPFAGLGSVGGDRLVVTGSIDLPLADLRRAHDGALGTGG